jgi:hypothetical protein
MVNEELLKETLERLEQIRPKFDRTEENFGLVDTELRFLRNTLAHAPQVATKDISIKTQKDAGFYLFVRNCIERFLQLDWGNMHQEDLESNDECLFSGEGILASYEHPVDESMKIWIIADAFLDTGFRQAVTIMFPDDY